MELDNKSFGSCDRGIKEAVCIDTNRVYDSCADKDCLSDLRLMFTDRAQCIIDMATSIRARGAEVINTTINVDPVQFNRGCYSVDITYFFRVYLDVCTTSGMPAQNVSGLASFSKKCILFGSEGNVKVFTSDIRNKSCDNIISSTSTAPRAKVQVVDPITLDARLVKVCDCRCVCIPECGIPDCVRTAFDGEFGHGDGQNAVLVTLGLFSIVQLERDVQMLIPAYDFCVPTKECCIDSPDPCDTFRKISFPLEEFFPPHCKADMKK
ncbi:MAG: hypothetical protein ACI4RU_02815 [Acutalibacteraceae bacterium]